MRRVALARGARAILMPMHKTIAELENWLDEILAAPTDSGPIEMIVLRPAVDERETLESGVLDTEVGLIGDNWMVKGSSSTSDGRANPEAQLTLMSSRVAAAIAGTRDRWPLAGDQIYVDMNLSVENLPPGTRLRIGDANIEISAKPHTGCDKFAGRFGKDALRFANAGGGRAQRFRGVNAFVVTGGAFRVGDEIAKM